MMLFLGLLFNRSEEHVIAAKSDRGFLQNQVNTFQWNCIDGLYENGVADLTIINALPVGTYPRMYSDVIIPTKEWIYNGRKHFQLGSFNLPILKQWGRCRTCKKLLKQLNDKEILIYSPYQPYLKAIKHLDENYRVTLIVPDLPAYYDYAKVGWFKKILRNLNNHSISRCMKRIDRFVLLTEAMKEPLMVGDRPYTIVEGICKSKLKGFRCGGLLEKKVILYTGSLNKQFGIDVLVAAFKQIANEEYELWICGGGDYQEVLQMATKQDSRIKFWGYVSQEKILEFQSQASVLVNPRQNTGEYTKYSFPSKIMEYLLSGVPVVAYKLDGIPDDYDPYINYVENSTPEALTKLLLEVCEDKTGDFSRKAQSAISYVSNEKNTMKQAKKILNLINFK